jgi:putative DNA primase/helicase
MDGTDEFSGTEPRVGARLDRVLADEAIPPSFYSHHADWLWPGYLPFRTVTILEGGPDLGKTLLALDLAARVTRGFTPPGNLGTSRHEPTHEPAGVVYFGAEDELATGILSRFLAAGGDPARLLVFTDPPCEGKRARFTPRPATLDDEHKVLHAITSVAARLVIFDPYTAYLGCGYYGGDDKGMRRLVEQHTYIARQAQCTVVLVRPTYRRSARSDCLLGTARSVLRIIHSPAPEHPHERVLFCLKHHLAADPPAMRFHITTPNALIQDHVWELRTPEPLPTDCRFVPCLQWDGAYHAGPAELISNSSIQRPTAIEEAMHLLKQALKDGPRPVRNVLCDARLAAIPRATLHRARVMLGVCAEREGYGANGRWVWVPPWSSSPATRQSPSAPQDSSAFAAETPPVDSMASWESS